MMHDSKNATKKSTQADFRSCLTSNQDPVRTIVHQVLEEYVESAFREFMGGRTGAVVARSSDGKPVIDYRNGHRTIRQVPIDTLILHNFKIRRNRAGGFKTDLLQRFRRRAGRLAALALELFINGVSTRKVRRSFERLGIKVSGLSKSTVSDITKDLMKEYLKWSNRPICREFAYLQVDTVYIRVRKSSKRKVGTMIVVGIGDDGHKEVLHFTIGNESARHFDEVLQSLIRRGFAIDSVRLVTTDGAKGPIKSICDHFGPEVVQRCTVHKTENIIEKCPTNLREELKAKLQRLWNMPSRLDAEQYLDTLQAEYGAIAPRAIECLCEDREDLLRYFGFPDEHRKTIRNTNLIERVIREVRRRTKVMDSLDNEYGCYGILMGIVREQNERWSKRSHWKKS
ncbi:MAG: IS256 family transposase [Candidatus Latescibacteria bacterium]|nr:IS256 family transposase [Candidatus Latescibacterota bacterium]